MRETRPPVRPVTASAAADIAPRDSASGDGRAAAPPGAPPRPPASADVAATLGLGEGARSKRRARRVLRWAVPTIVLAAVALLFVLRRGPEPTQYQTVNARRGDLAVTVSATGTLAPLDTVDVGTEVSGIVDVVAADYNDHVRKGQTLAVLNTDQLRARILQARAALQAARAAAQQTAATLTETRLQAARAESLFKSRLVSPQDVESARAALARASGADASARAQVAGARASLEAEQTSLGKATIRSPIDGIVLERQVERGRTVAATFQTPVLFVLAADLTRMTLALDIDEADIGQVTAGQTAQFTVDAYPDRVFPATLRSVRNAAKTVEGVVTYQAILDVANPDLLLRPGMTATARIGTAGARDALLVPNAALRFTPPSDSASSARGGVSSAVSGGARRVWTLRGGSLRAIPVRVGLTDGQWTEVTGGAVTAGTPLVVGVAGEGATSTASTSNPQTGGGHPPPLMTRGARVR